MKKIILTGIACLLLGVCGCDDFEKIYSEETKQRYEELRRHGGNRQSLPTDEQQVDLDTDVIAEERIDDEEN